MIVPAELRGANLTQGTARLAPAENTSGRFLYWALQSKAATDYWDMAVAGATFRALNLGPLVETPMPKIPLDAQRRIADFLDDQVARIDRAVQLRQRENEIVREQRTALVASIISGEGAEDRVPTDLPWLDQLPAQWKAPKITYAARLGSGHTPSRNRPEWWVDCTVPWITTGEVAALRNDDVEEISDTREKLSELGIENSSAETHPAGTVVLSRTASAGYSGVMATEMCTSQDFVTWTCSPRLDPYWLLWCLRAMRSDLLGRLAMGSTFKTIYVPDIQTLRIPLPPLADQRHGVREIRRVVEATRRRTSLISRAITLLEERQSSLITAAVTGQLDVTTARAMA